MFVVKPVVCFRSRLPRGRNLREGMLGSLMSSARSFAVVPRTKHESGRLASPAGCLYLCDHVWLYCFEMVAHVQRGGELRADMGAGGLQGI